MALFDPPYGHIAEYRIRTYEVDQRKYLTVPALIRLLHEAAMENVIRLQLSVWDLESKKVSWVLLRKCLRIRQYPRLGDLIRVITYPAQWDRVFAYRDFWVYDENDVLLGTSSTTWVLMNTETRKLSPIPDEIKNQVKPWAPPDGLLPVCQGKLTPFERPDQTYSHRVGWYEMDWNGHLNNSLYIHWMLDALPVAVLSGHQLQEMMVHFKAEATLDDRIEAAIQKGVDVSTWKHQLLNTEGNPLSMARTVWRPND